MKAKLLALALIASVGVTSASAQYSAGSDTTLTNLSLRLGGGIPIDGKLNDLFDGFINVGLDYMLPNPLISGAGESYLSVDWFVGDSKFRNNMFPIMLTQRFPLNQMGGRNTWAGIGVGAIIADLGVSKTVFGVKGTVGTDLGQNTFAEAFLLLGDRVGSVRTHVLGLNVGYRF